MGDGRGRGFFIFLGEGAGEGADFEGLYYQSRSDCTRPEAVMGVGAGGVAYGVRGYYPRRFF